MTGDVTPWVCIGGRLEATLRGGNVDLCLWTVGDRIVWRSTAYPRADPLVIEHGSTAHDLQGLSEAAAAAVGSARRWVLASRSGTG